MKAALAILAMLLLASCAPLPLIAAGVGIGAGIATIVGESSSAAVNIHTLEQPDKK